MRHHAAPKSPTDDKPPYAAIALISAAALAYEILLTRIFAIVHWHHLVSVAISLALLGYGASGTFLVLFGDRLRRHFAAAFVAHLLLFGVAVVFCVHLAQRIAFDPLALVWEPRQLIPLTTTFLLLAVPFFIAANGIGLALWVTRTRVATLYAADLMGAAAGTLLLLGALTITDAARVLHWLLPVSALSAIVAAVSLRWYPRRVTLVALGLIVMHALVPSGELVPATYKDLSRALAVDGASIEHSTSDIEGRIDIVDNPVIPIRSAPGLSLLARSLPPKQRALYIDGELSGTLVDFRQQPDASRFLTESLGALPFRIGRPLTRVAVLQAGTGARVQQALHLGAQHVLAVDTRPHLQMLVCGRYAWLQPEVCLSEGVVWQTQAARAAMAASTEDFDLITLALSADPAGLDALSIDHEATVEALSVYLRRLGHRGVLAIEGPTRLPPRLSLRVLDTARRAIRATGVTHPEQHLAMLRAWNRFVILATPTAWTAGELQAMRTFGAQFAFDLVWLPAISRDEVNRFQQQPSPLFHDGARQVLAGKEAGGCDDPPRREPITDDRPYPWLSTCWREWFSAVQSGQRSDWTRLDTGFLLALAVASVTGAAAVLLILLPLALLRRPSTPADRRVPWLRTLAYFGLIGGAFLTLEIAWIDHLQMFLGHPLYATSVVLAGMLLFAGAGSAWSQRRAVSGGRRLLRNAVVVIVASAVVYLVALPGLFEYTANAPLAIRAVIALLLLAPPAFAMGIPFPVGLTALQRHAAPLVPWAWGINGCASVIAAATAPLLSAELGFSGLVVLSALSYAALSAIGLLRKCEIP